MSWDAVPLDAQLGRLAPANLAIIGVDPLGRRTVVLAKVHKPKRDNVTVDFQDTAVRDELGPLAGRTTVPRHTTISDFALASAQINVQRAGTVPKIAGLAAPLPAWSLVLMIAIGVTLAVAGSIVGVPQLALPGTVLVLSALATHRMQANDSSWRQSPRVLDQGRDILPSRIAELLGTPAPTGPTPAERVSLVKDEWVALQSDIVYRIENSALFDPAVAQTQDFQLALMSWDASSPDASRLADEVEDAFAAARSHAERLGFNHLPETARDSARRAGRAAATALSSDHEGERRAAAARAAEILSSLALYYLPVIDPDAPALVGVRKQIEPR